MGYRFIYPFFLEGVVTPLHSPNRPPKIGTFKILGEEFLDICPFLFHDFPKNDSIVRHSNLEIYIARHCECFHGKHLNFRDLFYGELILYLHCSLCNITIGITLC